MNSSKMSEEYKNDYFDVSNIIEDIIDSTRENTTTYLDVESYSENIIARLKTEMDLEGDTLKKLFYKISIDSITAFEKNINTKDDTICV